MRFESACMRLGTLLLCLQQLHVCSLSGTLVGVLTVSLLHSSAQPAVETPTHFVSGGLQEWVPGGELFHHLDIEGSFSDAAACFYAANVLLALECLHARGIVYRDLKPENLLLDTKVRLMGWLWCWCLDQHLKTSHTLQLQNITQQIHPCVDWTIIRTVTVYA